MKTGPCRGWSLGVTYWMLASAIVVLSPSVAAEVPKSNLRPFSRRQNRLLKPGVSKRTHHDKKKGVEVDSGIQNDVAAEDSTSKRAHHGKRQEAGPDLQDETSTADTPSKRAHHEKKKKPDEDEQDNISPIESSSKRAHRGKKKRPEPDEQADMDITETPTEMSMMMMAQMKGSLFDKFMKNRENDNGTREKKSVRKYYEDKAGKSAKRSKSAKSAKTGKSGKQAKTSPPSDADGDENPPENEGDYVSPRLPRPGRPGWERDHEDIEDVIIVVNPGASGRNADTEEVETNDGNIEIPYEDDPVGNDGLEYDVDFIPVITKSPSTERPTDSPSKKPTTEAPITPLPTDDPTGSPTIAPITPFPSLTPSKTPTTESPSRFPTDSPSDEPTMAPTDEPSFSPTTETPSSGPTTSPSKEPTSSPSNQPTGNPTTDPTRSPTSKPTTSPSSGPTNSPSSEPTNNPTPLPYCPPTYDPLETNYMAGQLVELDSFIFQCNEEEGYAVYCGINEWDDDLLAQDESAKEKWNEAWIPLSACYTTETPTSSPSGQPTDSPSTVPTEGPSAIPTKVPSKGPTASPSTSPTSSPNVMMLEADAEPNNATLELAICPPPYDSSEVPSYVEGTEVEVMNVVYRCKPDLYAFYCTQLDFQPDPEGELNHGALWTDAWEAVGPCHHNITPGPTSSPTSGIADESVNTSPVPRIPINPPSMTVPGKRFTKWTELDPADRVFARDDLGYTRPSWNIPGTNDVESWAYADLYENEKAGAQGLGIDEELWDCHINHYLGYWWDDLVKLDLDRYFSVLGWDKDSWDNEATAPDTEDMSWDELSPEQQAVAEQLCYQKGIWDTLPLSEWQITSQRMLAASDDGLRQSSAVRRAMVVVPEKRFIQWTDLNLADKIFAKDLGYARNTWNIPGTNDVETWSYSDLYDNEKSDAQGLGIDQDMWDCHINHYHGYWWEDIERLGIDKHYAVLGWDIESWDNEVSVPETENMYWNELTTEQQAAAAHVCYHRDLWDMIPLSQWQTDLVVGASSSVELTFGALPSLSEVGDEDALVPPMTMSPSSPPSSKPVTESPSKQPTAMPTKQPTPKPTESPTNQPTVSPTTSKPSQSPTLRPTQAPTPKPSESPTAKPRTVNAFGITINPATGNVPEKRFVRWTSLSDDDKSYASSNLGYARNNWNVPGTNGVEAWRYSDLYDDEIAGAEGLGINEHMWDCFINHYSGYWWEDMEQIGIDKYFSVLGWTKDSWDYEESIPETENMDWDELTPEQQSAAKQVCYHRDLWNMLPLAQWESTFTVSATENPTKQPSEAPTRTPSLSPSFTEQAMSQITPRPKRTSSDNPSSSPTHEPTQQLYLAPINEGTKSPSHQPTMGPTTSPTSSPSGRPSGSPTRGPSMQPTSSPIKSPSSQPTLSPTFEPTSIPSGSPSSSPTLESSGQPSLSSSQSPSTEPTLSPTLEPTSIPSDSPSSSPTLERSGQPSLSPTKVGTDFPSSSPTMFPSASPSGSPSSPPTQRPTKEPSESPSSRPTMSPITPVPSKRPSSSPTGPPSSQPTGYREEDSTATPASLLPTQTPSSSTLLAPAFEPEIAAISIATDEVHINPAAITRPEKRYLKWSSLSDGDIIYATSNLGYDQKSWNNPGSAGVEDWSYHDLYEDEIVGAAGLGMDDEMWDCHINHYSGYWWEDIEHYGYAKYFTVLGWDVDSWDNDAEEPDTEDLYWDELTPAQQEAATQLCYFQQLWDGEPIPAW